MKLFNLLITLFFPIFISCESPSGHGGISQDMKDSKKRGVFIAEYKVYPNPYKINDTLQITVKEAWLEKRWMHGKNEEETLLFQPENYQLCINTVEEDVKNMYFDWTIGINGDKYIRSSNESSLVGDFENMPGDTIEYKVQKGNNLSDNGKKIIIGKLVLIKKKS
jgi:hypothetical protein